MFIIKVNSYQNINSLSLCKPSKRNREPPHNSKPARSKADGWLEAFWRLLFYLVSSPDECWLFTFLLIYLESQLIKLFPSAIGLVEEGAYELETLSPPTYCR